MNNMHSEYNPGSVHFPTEPETTTETAPETATETATATATATAPATETDGNNSTCVNVTEKFYRKLFQLPNPQEDIRVVTVAVVGKNLECDVNMANARNGLQVLMNTAADLGPDLCQLGQEMMRCRCVVAGSSLCEYECTCPTVEAGGCQSGMLYWNQRQPVLDNPKTICEIVVE